jgi:hypothetical protein
VREAGLAVMTERDHPSRNDHRAGLLELVLTRGLKATRQLARPVRDGKAVTERVDSGGAQRLQLLEAPSNEVIRLGLG